MATPAVSPNRPPQGAGTIPAELLCSWTGLTDRRHRQIAAEGYFPPPVGGRYQANATIAGIIRYFRELKQTTTSQERFDAARANREERKDDIEARNVLPLPLVTKILNGVLLELRQKILYLEIPQAKKEEILKDLQDIPIEVLTDGHLSETSEDETDKSSARGGKNAPARVTKAA